MSGVSVMNMGLWITTSTKAKLSRPQVIAEQIAPLKVLKHRHCDHDEIYFIVEDEQGNVFPLIALTEGDGGSYGVFKYKIVEQKLHKYFLRCPVEFLPLITLKDADTSRWMLDTLKYYWEDEGVAAFVDGMTVKFKKSVPGVPSYIQTARVLLKKRSRFFVSDIGIYRVPDSFNDTQSLEILSI